MTRVSTIILLLSLCVNPALGQSTKSSGTTLLQAQQSHLDTNSLSGSAADKNTSHRIPRASAQPVNVDTNDSPQLKRGKFFSRHGEYKEALDFFNQAALADPKNPEPYNRRARAEWQLEDLDHALEDARYAIKLNPDYAEAFCTRAAIFNSMGHYQEAIIDAALAHELKPSLRDAYILEAAAYRNMRQYREADEALTKLNFVSNPETAFDEFSPNIDYGAFLNYMQNTVRGNWQGPSGDYGTIVVLFKVHRDGKITDVRINNSGNASADSLAIQAANKSSPLIPPPVGSPPDFDVYAILDPPARQTSVQSVTPTSVAPITLPNWGGTINQGLGLMQRFIPR
jgi:TonB family protein